MKRRVAIFGGTGQLGTELADVLRQSDAFDVVPLGHEDADCTDTDSVRNALRRSRPETVINCAAYVRVDDCEDHAREAFEINALGALNVARGCAEVDALCVYVSTDYVFDGAHAAPYVESDAVHPINVYGTSKLAGEYLTCQAAPRWLIVRAASLFGRVGARGKGGNFIETVLSKAKRDEPLRVVKDVRMSPTYARDAASAVAALIDARNEGIVHVTNAGACTWYEFATTVIELAGLRKTVVPIATADYPTRARRPINSALRSERGLVTLRSWQDAVKAYLVEKGHIGRHRA